MTQNRILGLVCGFYLSRFDEIAYSHLGFGNKNETHSKLGRILDVPANTVKGWRDAFDPVHENDRVGWYQRPMTRSRLRTIECVGALSEFELHSIITEFLGNPNNTNAIEIVRSIGDVADEDDLDNESDSTAGLRGPTGHAAEMEFARHHSETGKPINGTLHDCRHEQCGCDYRIDSENGSVFVEVKGLSDESGGITFTNKEWNVAREMLDQYYLVVVRNISQTPDILIINNPTQNLAPKMRVYSTVQTSWSCHIAR